MSHSILKRCLQLVEEDLPECSSSKQTAHKKKQKKNYTIFDMIPEQKRLTITKKTGKNAVKRKFQLFSIAKTIENLFFTMSLFFFLSI